MAPLTLGLLIPLLFLSVNACLCLFGSSSVPMSASVLYSSSLSLPVFVYVYLPLCAYACLYLHRCLWLHAFVVSLLISASFSNLLSPVVRCISAPWCCFAYLFAPQGLGRSWYLSVCLSVHQSICLCRYVCLALWCFSHRVHNEILVCLYLPSQRLSQNEPAWVSA